ncbi:MAG: hypothetical protein N2595_06785 [bacterium]|nr:hypothetical protein [bacterium]
MTKNSQTELGLYYTTKERESSGTLPSWRRPIWNVYIVWLVVMAFVLAWYENCGNWWFPCSPDPLRARMTICHNVYAGQTEGLLRGSLAPSFTPGPALRAIENAHHGGVEWPCHPYNVAYYKGRYYLYHGVVPVVTLFLPQRFMLEAYIPKHLAAVMFFIVTLAAQIWFTWRLLAHRLSGLPRWHYHAGAVMWSLSLPGPYVLCGRGFLRGGK